jgi:hypothetical protein
LRLEERRVEEEGEEGEEGEERRRWVCSWVWDSHFYCDGGWFMRKRKSDVTFVSKTVKGKKRLIAW